jgi:uncharacterized protein DUF3237
MPTPAPALSITAETVDLSLLCDIAVDLAPAQVISTPSGLRVTYIIERGTVTGERLRGEVLPGGGDWLLFGSDGIGRLDVRATLRVGGGELVHLAATGVSVVSDEAKARLAAGERVAAREMFIRSQPRFEADPNGPHAWLNAIATVALNHFAPGRVDYRVFEVR